jgi:hypothetical protein
MDATNSQQQQQEPKASMEKTADEEGVVGSSSSDVGDPVQNHRGWKAMPYIICE